VVLVLVGNRVQGLSAAGTDLIGKLHHLVNRLPAIEPHDVIFDVSMQLLARLSGACGRESIDHHRDHHARPIAANERQRPVEVKQHRPKLSTNQIRAENFNHRSGDQGSGVRGQAMRIREDDRDRSVRCFLKSAFGNQHSQMSSNRQSQIKNRKCHYRFIKSSMMYRSRPS
jgi:hypothetical protein